MAGGELTLKLDDETVRRLRAAADAAGVSIEAYAADILSEALAEDWAEDFHRVADYKRTGASLSVQEWSEAFRGALEEEIAKRK